MIEVAFIGGTTARFGLTEAEAESQITASRTTFIETTGEDGSKVRFNPRNVLGWTVVEEQA